YREEGAGMNPALKPSVSRDGELGLKWRDDQTRLDLALFHSRVRDEIVTGPNQVFTGRSTYTNAGRSTRRGVEFSIEQDFAHGVSGYLAYTWLDASYDSYENADGTRYDGNRLPGVPRHSAYAELLWQPAGTGFHTAIEAQGMSRRYATDDNLHSASGYGVVHWRAGYRHQLGNLTLEPFARLENLTDRDYVGSLIVNGAGDRYYEPAPGRSWLAGLGVQYQWRCSTRRSAGALHPLFAHHHRLEGAPAQRQQQEHGSHAGHQPGQRMAAQPATGGTGAERPEQTAEPPQQRDMGIGSHQRIITEALTHQNQ